MGSGLRVTQPWLSFAFESQSVASTIWLVWFAPACVQPGSVCRPICADVTLFTPSNVSISPPCGHTCADDQNAGQTEHLAGRGRSLSAAGAGAGARADAPEWGVGHVGDPDGADGVAVLGHDADRVAVVAERLLVVLSTRMMACPEPSTYASLAPDAVCEDTYLYTDVSLPPCTRRRVRSGDAHDVALGEVVDLVVEYPVVEEVLALIRLDQAVLRRERGRGRERECAEQRGGERGGDGEHGDDVGGLDDERNSCGGWAPRERKDSEESEGGVRESGRAAGAGDGRG
jgi:hypothetical protein